MTSVTLDDAAGTTSFVISHSVGLREVGWQTLDVLAGWLAGET